MKKKTVYVWIILILSAIGIVFGLFSFIQSLIHIKTLIMPAFLSSPIMNIGSFVLQTAGTVLLFIFFIKLYNLSQNLVKWTNIVFGYLTLGLFSSIFIIMSLFKMPIIFALKFLNPIIIIIFIIIIFIIGIIWFTFVRHLKRNKERLFGGFESENKIERPVKKFQFNKVKFFKITKIILTLVIIIFITFFVSKKISGTDVIESRLMMIQNEILSYKTTLNGSDSQILYSVVCNDNFLLDRKMEILDITRGKFKCFNNNTDYIIAAKMKDKFGYFCIDSRQNIGGVKINAGKYNFINENSIYCPTKASLQESDQSVIDNNIKQNSDVVSNEQEQIIKKFVKGRFKIIDTGEIFEYTEEYKPNDIGYLRDYNANAVNDCINTSCSSIYFMKAPYSTQGKIAIYNTNDDFRDGVIENVEFYLKNEKVLSYSELKSIDDRIVYTIKSKISDYYSSYLSNEYPCLEISSGVIKCRQPIFNIGDKIVTFGSKDDGSYLRGKFLLNKITKAQLISYQYFMDPDTGEVFPVIQR